MIGLGGVDIGRRAQSDASAVPVGRSDGRSPRTYGYLRVEILAAVTNALLLFGVAAFILFDIEHSIFQLETVDRRRLEERSHA